MKRWITIIALVAVGFAQGAQGFHDHPITEEPVQCVACNHLHCFSLPAVAEAIPHMNHELLGTILLERLAGNEIQDAKVVADAPKTSPPASV